MIQCTTSLARGVVSRPDRPALQVELFASWQQAIAHLRDHVLTAPECQAWAVVFGHPDCLPVAGDHLGREEISRQAHETLGTSAQPLYDLYVDAVATASRDASQLGWYAAEGCVTVALGSAGVLVVIEGSIMVTAFLPGQGDPMIVRSASLEARGFLPRERGMRSGRPDRSALPRQRLEQEQRRQGWSTEERLFHDVFRPAVRFIRSRYHSSRDAGGRLLTCDYALLKPVLPPCSRLSLSDWQSRRVQCGHGGLT